MPDKLKRLFGLVLLGGLLFWMRPETAWAKPQTMHIMEGFLPLWWSIFWWVVAAPFWAIGFWQVKKLVQKYPEQRLLLGLAGGFIFVLSALKIPSVTGSSSHPTGTGLGTMLFGPFVIAILGTIALLFQALMVAHGGLSTLGANAVSMAIGGPLIAYFCVWRPFHSRIRINRLVFLTAFVADLATYLITTTQLALAFPDPVTGILGSWIEFVIIFAVTQVPLAVAEGILTVLIYDAIRNNMPAELLNIQKIWGGQTGLNRPAVEEEVAL